MSFLEYARFAQSEEGGRFTIYEKNGAVRITLNLRHTITGRGVYGTTPF